MTTREEILNILEQIKSLKVQQIEIEEMIEEAQEEEEPAYEAKVDYLYEQSEKYKEIVSKYCLVKSINGTNSFLVAELYGIELFKIFYDNNNQTVSYVITPTAKKFVDSETKEIISKVEKYVAEEFPTLQAELACLQMQKSKHQCALASLYAKLSLTPCIHIFARSVIKKDIRDVKSELNNINTTIEPLEKRFNKLIDPKMKEILADVYLAQEELRDCLEIDEEYKNIRHEWQIRASTVRELEIQKETISHKKGELIRELICSSEMIEELIGIRKSYKVHNSLRTIAREVIEIAAEREESLRRFCGYGPKEAKK